MPSQYLRYRDGLPQFRRAIPVDLRVTFAQSELIRSVSGVSAKDLIRTIGRLTDATERLFMVVRSEPGLTRTDIERITAMFLDDAFIRRETDLAGRLASPAPGWANAEVFPTYVLERTKHRLFKEALANGPLTSTRAEACDWARKAGLSIGETSDEALVLARALMRAKIKESEDVISLIETEFMPQSRGGDILDQIFDRRTSPAPRPAADTKPAEPEIEQPSVDGAERTFSSLWRAFGDDQVLEGKWKPCIRRQNRSTGRLFVEICGDRDVAAYTSADVAEFKRTMLKLPALYSKDPKFSRVLAADGPVALAAEIESKKIVCPMLSRKTVNRHLAALSGIWPWAQRQAFLAKDTPSPSKDQGLPKSKKSKKYARDERESWTPGALETFFASPIFTGALSRRQPYFADRFVFRDERYWGSLLGPHTGMRREEIFQLRVEHVLQDEETGIWHIDLFADHLELKDVGSPRLVPLHKNLLRLGFIEARVNGRPPTDQLFPEAKRSAADEPYGDDFGKWFSRYRASLGIPKGQVFHAFRGTFVTRLDDVGVPKTHVEELAGFESAERRSMFYRYNKAKALEILHPAINKLVLPIDVARLKEAVRRSEQLDRSTVWPKLVSIKQKD